MEKTAVEWFLSEFQKEVWFEPESELDIWIKNLIPKAKEMEKEQIINYHNFIIQKFVMLEYTYNTKTKIIVENYYNETFNK